VIGFPNVGKSALINRLLGRKMAVSRNMPGVTKSLRWVRIGGSAGATADNLELLDSPGIIPARQFDQHGALKLAICNDIGEASYDRVIAAQSLCDQLISLYKQRASYVDMIAIRQRYNIPFDDMNGEEIVYRLAQDTYQGNTISSADKVLGDFRKGLLGYGSLEAPVMNNIHEIKYDRDQVTLSMESNDGGDGRNGNRDSMKKEFESLDIGRGNYDGW